MPSENVVGQGNQPTSGGIRTLGREWIYGSIYRAGTSDIEYIYIDLKD